MEITNYGNVLQIGGRFNAANVLLVAGLIIKR